MNLQYIRVPDGAAVLACTGSGASVRLPDKVDGLPVKEICPYAFSAPGAAAAHLPPGADIREASVSVPAEPEGTGHFLGGEFLRQLRLPARLRSVGAYAFYNCTGLSRIVLGAGSAQVGNGALMNCAGLEEIAVEAPSTEKTCLPGFLAELQREVRAVFRFGGKESVWIFPEYYEESVENCPARIFEHFIRGAGFRYRQCFRGDRLDAESYDEQFQPARNETGRGALLHIALWRLRRPDRLSEEAGKRYLAFLKENAAAAAQLLIREDDPEGLSFLASRGAFTPEEIGAAAEQASRLERARCLGVLLHERQSRFPKKNKTFDL